MVRGLEKDTSSVRTLALTSAQAVKNDKSTVSTVSDIRNRGNLPLASSVKRWSLLSVRDAKTDRQQNIKEVTVLRGQVGQRQPAPDTRRRQKMIDKPDHNNGLTTQSPTTMCNLSSGRSGNWETLNLFIA